MLFTTNCHNYTHFTAHCTHVSLVSVSNVFPLFPQSDAMSDVYVVARIFAFYATSIETRFTVFFFTRRSLM